jgi:RhtB (resistance to homoserine/threonine) family protein
VHVDLIPFLALSILLILIPGPDTAVVTKNALGGGRRGGVFAAIGVAVGLVTWTLMAALGIAALLRASEVAFTVLKIVGAVYLVWIGVQLLRKPGALAAAGAGMRPTRARKALRQGLLSDLGNPKIAVFFTSFLPQFVHGTGSPFAPLLLLGGIFALLTLAWLSAYGAAIGHGTKLLRRPRVQKALDRFTGVVLLGFGVRLAFEHR